MNAKTRNLARFSAPRHFMIRLTRVLLGRTRLFHSLTYSDSVAMRTISIVFGLLALAISSVYGTALTYKLSANEKACFFTDVQRPGAKVAFYFAVCLFLFRMFNLTRD